MIRIKGEKWKPVELSFISECEYQDPFYEAELDVIIHDERGNRWKIPGFWNGGKVWKARFSAPEKGIYEYETQSIPESDTGLNNQKGRIEVEEYKGTNPLYLHGPVRIMDDGRHFMHRDGTPFPWLGDTWWNVESSRMSEKGEVELLAKDRADKGFTLISITNGFWCDLKPYDERLSNEAGYPWKENFETINPEFYCIADKKIQQITDAGLAVAMAAAWGFYIRFMGVEKMKRHVRYMVARYAAYPVIWITAGETAMPYYDYHGTKEYDTVLADAKRDWTQVLEYLRTIDPYQRITSVHVTYNRISMDDIEKPELIDFIMYQAGVHDGNQEMVSEQVENLTKRGLAEMPKRPVVNSETCYEGMLYQCGPALQRWLFWHAALDGSAGWTYGANGIFTASHENAPFGTAYYGTNWGEQTWQEAMHFEGAKQIGCCRKYLNQYEWWKLRPVQDKVKEPEGKTAYEHTVVAEIKDQLIMAYMQRNVVLTDTSNYPYCIRFKNLRPGIKYSVKAYNPIRDYEIVLGEEVVDEKGELTTPVLPILQDWVVIMEQKSSCL